MSMVPSIQCWRSRHVRTKMRLSPPFTAMASSTAFSLSARGVTGKTRRAGRSCAALRLTQHLVVHFLDGPGARRHIGQVGLHARAARQCATATNSSEAATIRFAEKGIPLFFPRIFLLVGMNFITSPWTLTVVMLKRMNQSVRSRQVTSIMACPFLFWIACRMPGRRRACPTSTGRIKTRSRSSRWTAQVFVLRVFAYRYVDWSFGTGVLAHDVNSSAPMSAMAAGCVFCYALRAPCSSYSTDASVGADARRVARILAVGADSNPRFLVSSALWLGWVPTVGADTYPRFHAAIALWRGWVPAVGADGYPRFLVSIRAFRTSPPRRSWG